MKLLILLSLAFGCAHVEVTKVPLRASLSFLLECKNSKPAPADELSCAAFSIEGNGRYEIRLKPGECAITSEVGCLLRTETGHLYITSKP